MSCIIHSQIRVELCEPIKMTANFHIISLLYKIYFQILDLTKCIIREAISPTLFLDKEGLGDQWNQMY